MIKQRLALSILGGVMALGAATLNHAGIRELVENVVNDKITFELSVFDGRDTPVDGATVWFFGDDATRTDLRVEDMRRLVARHGGDVDGERTNTVVISTVHPGRLPRNILTSRLHSTNFTD